MEFKKNEKAKGWKDRAEIMRESKIEKKRKELEESKKTFKNWTDSASREIKKNGKVSKDVEKGFDTAEKIYNSLKAELEIMTSENTFVDQGIEYTGYLPTRADFSTADYCGRYNIDKLRNGFAVDKYHDTDIAESIEEGAESTPKDLLNYLYMVETDKNECIKFCDILGVGETIGEDDPEAIDGAHENTHKKHIINAENKAIFEKITSDVPAVDVSTLGVIGTINDNLCGKAKVGAEIWTNKSGFALLDVDGSNGLPLITKDSNGVFIYKGKYIVREFANEILPNTDNSAPILIGDFKNIIRFAVVGAPTSLEKLDMYNFIKYTREICYEIPLLTTTDSEALVNGYLPLSNN